MKHESLLNDWVHTLPFQQQAVLVMALRGQDGDKKETHFKTLVRMMRGTVIKSALARRELELGESAGDYMQLITFQHIEWFENVVKKFLSEEADSVITHAFCHFMHAAEICAYKHPNAIYRQRWILCYHHMVNYLHLVPETPTAMEERLDDFGSYQPTQVPVD